MRDELPLPPHADPATVGSVWKVDYEARFHDALGWAEVHAVPPASVDARRVCLLCVDQQNTFCTPGFELFVAGRSGAGALDDSTRLVDFLYRNLAAVTEVVVTMDTHQAFQIFHAPVLVDAGGKHPDPFTLVGVEDVASGRWHVDPEAAAALGLETDGDIHGARAVDAGARAHAADATARAERHLRAYVAALEAGGKYDLTIWPFHAMLGGIGHALVSAVEEAIFFHAIARRARTRFEVKGRNPLTEHYSALGPEVERGAGGEPLGGRNEELVEHLLGFDAVIVAGQAKSHCVAWTVADLLGRPDARGLGIADRLYLLEDCTSPVVVPGAVDYTDEADAAFVRFAGLGAHVVRSTEPMASWPGPIGAALAR